MSSVCVKEESDSRLHISIEPTGTTWAVIFGIFSLIIGCPLYNFDCACLVLLVWILGTAVLLAAYSPWQEVIVDKEQQSVVCSRQSLFQRYILQASTPVTIDLGNIELVKRDRSAFLFALRNHKTVQLNLKLDTQKLDELVEKIGNFLQQEYAQTKPDTAPSAEPEAGSCNLEGATNEDSSSATSDDSFERIDSADLVDYDHSKTEIDNDIPSESILSLSPSTEELKDLPLELEEQCPPAFESTPLSLDDQQTSTESVSGLAAPSDVGLNP